MKLNAVLAGCDLLLSAMIQSLPEKVEAETPEPYLTAIFNASRHPALSIPCGLSVFGLPIGLQLVGAHHAEATLLRAAAYEDAFGFPALPIATRSD
jgi:aspartyl-tRNA(Asn)/glutamyl-tRNA(Gln) amidotransferase subunit A